MNFKDMIEGKEVLLLGPAPYLYDGKFSKDLGDYDAVVKLNRMVETNLCEDFKNDRCDILYHCLDVNVGHGMTQYSLEFIKKKIKHLRIPYPPINPYYMNNINRFKRLNEAYRIEHSCISSEEYSDLFNSCGNTSPNTGTIAIYDILNQKPKSLMIKGITMFDGGYNSNYRTKVLTEEEVENINRIHKNHNTNNQRMYLKKVVRSYDNVYVDESFLRGLEIR